MKFHRDGHGGYISDDGHYQIEKGVTGWNVNEYNDRLNCHRYSFTAETLKEAKESCEQQ